MPKPTSWNCPICGEGYPLKHFETHRAQKVIADIDLVLEQAEELARDFGRNVSAGSIAAVRRELRGDPIK